MNLNELMGLNFIIQKNVGWGAVKDDGVNAGELSRALKRFHLVAFECFFYFHALFFNRLTCAK